MEEKNKACKATPDDELQNQLMSSNRAKSEVAWFAKRKIEVLEAENKLLREALKEIKEHEKYLGNLSVYYDAQVLTIAEQALKGK